MEGRLQYNAASQLGTSTGVVMIIQIQHSTTSSVSSNRFVATKPSKLFKFQNNFYYKFLIKLIFLHLQYLYLYGQLDSRESQSSQGNISTPNKSFLICNRLRNIFKCFMIQNIKVWKTCIFSSTLYMLVLYIDQVAIHVRQVSYYVIIKDLKDH